MPSCLRLIRLMRCLMPYSATAAVLLPTHSPALARRPRRAADDSPAADVVDAAAGWDHCLLLCSDGRAYGAGWNAHGQATGAAPRGGGWRARCAEAVIIHSSR